MTLYVLGLGPGPASTKKQKQMRLPHRYRKAKIDCLSLFMCPLLAQLKIGFFSSFSAAAVYSTNETNKAGLKQSIIFRCLWITSICDMQPKVVKASTINVIVALFSQKTFQMKIQLSYKCKFLYKMDPGL